MTFLPIVERELRVAARKRSTFWARIIAALVALVIGSGFLVLTTVGFGSGTVNLGKGLFATLTWLGLAAALSAGLFFTSDCLSEEKREGTLGFLFLTDLSGYDVVFGKLLATSLRGFYALVAVFPILAITLLLGGVTGAQFWKTSLALVNALFVSLTAGLFVSAISRHAQKAMGATLFLLVLWVGAGPASDAIFAALRQRTFDPVLSLSSPAYLFMTAGAWGKVPFWRGLLVNQAIAWTLLGLTCALLPRTWQEKAVRTSAAGGSWGQWWKFGGVKRRLVMRQKLIDENPVLWLACRERWPSLSLWAMALVAGGFVAALASHSQMGLWAVWNYCGGALTLWVCLGIASQSGRFLVEARRSGLIELLLTTPLTASQIVQGQWRALLRMFAPPLTLFLAVDLIGSAIAEHTMWSGIAATAPAPPPPTPATMASNTTGTTVITNVMVVTTPVIGSTTTVSVGDAPSLLVTLMTTLAETIALGADLVALVWFGMWMGLTSKNTNLATLKTILFVQIIPWFVIGFASSMITMLVLLPNLIRGGATMFWFSLLTSGVTVVLALIKNIAFLLWSRRKLYSEFRERAARDTGPSQLAMPELLSQANAPPVIAPT